jgi:hypothetical protein
MKKTLVAILVLVLVVAGGALYYLYTNLDALVKSAIETYGSEVTRTPVRVAKVRIDLQQGKGAIYGLTVANPAGFSTPRAFALQEASTRIDLKSLATDIVVIDDVTIRAPQVFYEMNANREGSLSKLYDDIATSIPAGSGSPKAAGKDAGPRLIIRHLRFSALIVPLENRTYSVKLPAIDMSNLGAPRGKTGAELAKEILARITKQAEEEVRKQVIDARLNRAIEAEKKKLRSQAEQQVEAEKKKAEQKLQDQLKGLIPR